MGLKDLFSGRPVELPTDVADKFWKGEAVKVIKDGFHRRYTDFNDTECIEDVAQELSKSFRSYNNGYEYAKQLEQDSVCSYNFDVLFCEHLDWINNLYDEALIEVVKVWAKEQGKIPRFSKGQKIMSTIFLNSAIRKDCIYFITGVKAETANYYVYENIDNNGGYVIPFEKLESCCIEVAD